MRRGLTIFAMLCIFGPSGQAVAEDSFWKYWETVQKRHSEINVLTAEWQAAEHKRRAAEAGRLPRVTSELRYLYEAQDYPGLNLSSRGADISILAEQNLVDLKAWNEQRLAQVDAETRAFLLEDQKSELRLLVIRNYFQAMILQERMAIYLQVYEPLIKNILSQGETALQNALRSRQEQTEWLLSFSQMQLHALDIQDDRDERLELLKAWAGWDRLVIPPRKSSFRPHVKWLERPTELPGQIPPGQQFAELEQKKAATQLQIQQAAFWPRLYMFAQWQQFSGQNESSASGTPLAAEGASLSTRSTSIGLGLQWTLFDGFQNVHNSNSALSSLEAARLRVRRSLQKQKLNESDRRRRMQSTLNRFNQLEELRKNTHQWLLSVMKMQKAGMRSFDALLPPLSRAYETETLYYQAMMDFFELSWTMRRELGRLDDMALREFVDQAIEHEKAQSRQ